MSAPLAMVQPLAKSGEALKSGPIGLAIILVLCIACYFLFKSMSKHLKTVREDFPTDNKPADDAAAQPSTPAPASAPTPTSPAAPSAAPPDHPVEPPEREA